MVLLVKRSFTSSSHPTFQQLCLLRHNRYFPPQHSPHNLQHPRPSNGCRQRLQHLHLTRLYSLSICLPRRVCPSKLHGTGKATTFPLCVSTISLRTGRQHLTCFRSGRRGTGRRLDSPALAQALSGALQEGQGLCPASTFPPHKTLFLCRRMFTLVFSVNVSMS